jgi:hypothetical protein
MMSTAKIKRPTSTGSEPLAMNAGDSYRDMLYDEMVVVSVVDERSVVVVNSLL